MVSVKPPAELMGERDRPNAVPYGLGYPRTTASQTRPVPFNDADALERVLDELDGQVAGVILEPAMMNINIVPPVDGYLRARRASSRTAHGVVLIFDEVKTGAAVAAGGATELFGVTPDVVCLAKAICGGLPGRRGRHDRGARRARGRRPRAPAGHVQRQPARDGRRRRRRCSRCSRPRPTRSCSKANADLMAGCDDVIAATASPRTRSAWARRAAS